MVPLLMIGAVYAAYLAFKNGQQQAQNAPQPVSPLFVDSQPGIIGGTAPNAGAGAAKANNTPVPSASASGVPSSDPRALAFFQAGAVSNPSAASDFFAHPYAPIWHYPSDVNTQPASQPTSQAVGAPSALTVLFNTGKRSAGASSGAPATGGGCSGGCGGCRKSRCAGSAMNLGDFQPSAQQIADWAETARTSGSISVDGLQAMRYLHDQATEVTPSAAPSYTHF